jgi:hypothetical protein
MRSNKDHSTSLRSTPIATPAAFYGSKKQIPLIARAYSTGARLGVGDGLECCFWPEADLASSNSCGAQLFVAKGASATEI